MNDGSGLEQVVFSYFEAFGRGDVDAILAHYAEDAVFMPAGAPSVVGLTALRAAYERTLTRVRILPGGVSVPHDVLTLGELAWVLTESRATAADPRSGEEKPGHFREGFLLRRVGSEWKIWRYLFNTVEVPS
jgi:ketosteroid isomerase-like protein